MGIGFGLGCAVINVCGGLPIGTLSSNINMAVQPAQTTRFMQPRPLRAWSPRSQHVLPPTRASTSQNELELKDEIIKMEKQMPQQGRREMIVGLVAAAGLQSKTAHATARDDDALASPSKWYACHV